MKKITKISLLFSLLFLFACSSDSGTEVNSAESAPGNNPQEDNSACIAMAEKYLPIPNSFPEMFTTSLNWVSNGNSSCVSKVWLNNLPRTYDTYYQTLIAYNWGELIGSEIPSDVRQHVNSEKYMYFNYEEEGGYQVVFQMWLSSSEQGGYDFNAVFSKIGGLPNNSTNPYSTDVEYVAKTYTNGIFSASYIANLAYKDESIWYWAYPVDKSVVDYVSYDRYDLENLLKSNGWRAIYPYTCSIADVVSDGILVAGYAQTSECNEIRASIVYNNKNFDIYVRLVSNGGAQTTFVYLHFLGWEGL